MNHFKAIFIICLFLTPNLVQVMGTDNYGNTEKIFTLTQTSSTYSVRLSRNDVQKGGIFSVFLSLRKGSSPLNFSYSYFYFKTYTNSHNITFFETGKNPSIFGRLNPGDNITILHEINQCVTTKVYSMDFKFEIKKNTLTNLNFSLEILQKGKDNSCNPSTEIITGDDFWVFILTSIIIIAILILYPKKK